MNLQQNKTRGLLQALMLALLLNLSGHVFLHLGDAVYEGEEAHFTAHHESKTASVPLHQCSICQDHQHLTLESPAPTSLLIEVKTAAPLRQTDSVALFLPAHFKPTRAPPRS